MKAITLALAAALILGAVGASPAVETVQAHHNSCEDDPDPRPCDPTIDPSPQYVCGYLWHYGLCNR